MRIGFYPGSFDPLTYGHLDIIIRSVRLVDHLFVGIGVNSDKNTLLPVDQRVEIIKQTVAPIVEQGGVNISVVCFDGLTVDAARQVQAAFLIKGLRNGFDLDQEAQMAQMNAKIASDIETIFMIASPAVQMIASSLVKQLAKMGGDVSPFVPEASQQALRRINPLFSQ